MRWEGDTDIFVKFAFKGTMGAAIAETIREDQIRETMLTSHRAMGQEISKLDFL
jgi:hypothetical protein